MTLSPLWRGNGSPSMATLSPKHEANLWRYLENTLFPVLGSKLLTQLGPADFGRWCNLPIALLQMLARKEGLAELLDAYGHIIVDEGHHLPVFSFEGILKQTKVRYILGLTATPERRDSHHPIIFMQCGMVRHSVTKIEHLLSSLEVRARCLQTPTLPNDATIQDVFRTLCEDSARNSRIVDDTWDAWNEGRKVLLLTERANHLEILREMLASKGVSCHILHGRLSRKQRALVLDTLQTMPDSAARVILATGKLIGEGFDHSPLDTIVLAMHFSWEGTLQQYAGRLHRQHIDKADIRVYDYVETDNPQLHRMWKKRRVGYTAMGYHVVETEGIS